MKQRAVTEDSFRDYWSQYAGLKPDGPGKLRGPCPMHGGQRDSFTVDLSTGLAYCHSQCNKGWNTPSFEMEMTGRSLHATKDAGIAKTKRTAIVYGYQDEQGKTLYQVVRKEPGENGAKKDFYQQRPNESGGFVKGIKGVRRVLYRLPQLVAADLAETVFIAEGEKDVETLETLGVLATCNSGGAGNFRAEFSDVLQGRCVVIIPDKDARGLEHAVKVGNSLLPVKCRVRVLELPGAQKDVSDWVAAGGTKEQFTELVNTAVDFVSWRTHHSNVSAAKLEVISADDLLSGEIQEPEALIDGLLYPGITIFAGRPKVGKSWLALELGKAAATGDLFLNRFQAKPLTVLYCALEEPKSRTASRLRKIMGRKSTLQRMDFIYRLLPLTGGGLEQLDAHLSEFPADLIIIDTWLAALGGAKANRDAVRGDYQEVARLRTITEKHNVAILIIHHLRKASAEYGLDGLIGTSGVSAAADAIWTINRASSGDCVLDVVGRDAEPLSLGLRLKSDEDSVGWHYVGAGGITALSPERREILDLLKAGPYKPREIADEIGKNGATVRRLLQGLISDGLIHKAPNGYEIAPVPF